MRSHLSPTCWRRWSPALWLAVVVTTLPAFAADAESSRPRILDTVDRARQLALADEPGLSEAPGDAELSPSPALDSSDAAPEPAVSEQESVATWLEQIAGGQGRQQRGAGLQLLLLMSVMSVAPALLLMTTSFIRISVVLAMLRQALGGQQTPSNQIVAGLAVLLTFLIMTPVWREVNETAVQPYLAEGSTMSLHEAWEAGVVPVRQFMSRQIDASRK